MSHDTVLTRYFYMLNAGKGIKNKFYIYLMFGFLRVRTINVQF